MTRMLTTERLDAERGSDSVGGFSVDVARRDKHELLCDFVYTAVAHRYRPISGRERHGFGPASAQWTGILNNYCEVGIVVRL
jgi:hypothetical protein